MDLMHGNGTFEWPDGRKYIGGWRNNLPHGKSQLINSKGEIKFGLWENGKRVKWFDTKELNKKREALSAL